METSAWVRPTERLRRCWISTPYNSLLFSAW